MADLVVGSGPSGIAAAQARLARGHAVVMIDAGAELEPAREAARLALGQKPPADWSIAERDAWRAPQFATPPGRVRRFGSDFAIEAAEDTFADPGGLELRASHAAGGLSNLWGSAVLPSFQADTADWPVTAGDLRPHYQAVARFLPISGGRDALAEMFPALDMTGMTPLAPGHQAEALLARWKRRVEAGDQSGGAVLGLARQAVAPGCRLCAQCLHGCPWRLIWSGRDGLAALRQQPGFTYRPGAPVRRFDETPHSVRLTLTDGTVVEGARAFLATGVLESARILLASRPALGQLDLRDSPHGFLPLLERPRPFGPRRPRPDRVPHHTLVKLFLEVSAPDLSPYLIHSQIYGYNEFYARELLASYGRRLPGSAPLWRALARRLMVAQIFLHSDHGPVARLRPAADGRLSVEVRPAADLPARFAAAAARVGRTLVQAGMLPLTMAARPGGPGSSFHAGATLPMARAPGPSESDGLGRPAGLSRLHVVDASVLPAIPATTITLTVMANAHRIASEAP